MKHYLLILIGSLALSIAQAASVKAQMSKLASDSESQAAIQAAEQSSGKAVEVVRNEEGKIVELVVSLPENDNEGIKRAKEALSSSNGVTTVHVQNNNFSVSQDLYAGDCSGIIGVARNGFVYVYNQDYTQVCIAEVDVFSPAASFEDLAISLSSMVNESMDCQAMGVSATASGTMLTVSAPQQSMLDVEHLYIGSFCGLY